MTLYQSRYPDTWIEDAEQMAGTFAVAKGSTLGTKSPLMPFHMNADGDMWTSTTSRNWTSFGYTYPELADNPKNDTLTQSINRLYKAQTQGLHDNDTSATALDDEMIDTGAAGSTQATDWLVKINMPTNIRISYSVRLFLGEPSPNPKDWATDPNYVGQLATLSSSRTNSSVLSLIHI